MHLDPLTARAYRVGLGVLVAFDAVQLTARTIARSDLSTSKLPVAPIFRWLGTSPAALVSLSLVGVATAALFVWSKRPILFGLLALGANRLLLEGFGAVDGIFDETSYHVGATTLGWIAGAAYARATEDDEPVSAGLGAAAGFAATYVCAGTSKLLDSGLSWADGDTIRLMIRSHRPLGTSTWNDSLRSLVGDSAGLAMALSIGTIVVQLGAVFFPWTRRTRVVWGTLFLAFHVGIHLVSGSIFFLQAVMLALLFVLPWPRIVARVRSKAPGERAAAADADRAGSLTPAGARRVRIAIGGALALLAVLVLVPIQPRAHPIERVRHATPGEAGGEHGPPHNTTIARLGPLEPGMALADGWQIGTIALEDVHVTLTIARDADEVVLDLSDRDGQGGPFDVRGLHVSYRETSVPFESFKAAGEALSKALGDAAVDPPSAFREWMEAAAP